ncbi:hypothetical protein BU23DRAFT_553070 [Bimuria novae-zelandiae CBS 107.79]|uniref:Uncharacterized protein n=1 Tax=Bimuria novae-zelandiae CBS 107.79 TaxID=1447943 RepID=A0A6A5VNC1_9PLEO|nr:hypothetical protein BU23DRAFT_553070 [Bimuria novae-zelandiae CBS 107.79]
MLSTITCVRSWLRAGYSPPQETPDGELLVELSELEMHDIYQVSQWDDPV